MKKDELGPIQSSESLVHKSETPMNQECISSETNNIVICEATGCFAKATASISIEAGQSMKVSECLCDHNECCGQYVDSVGLGLTLSCNCVCHNNNEKVEGDGQARQPDQSPTADRDINSGVLNN